MAAAFLSARVPPLVRGKVLESGQEKRAELSFASIHRAQVVLFQKAREEPLGQIFGVMLRGAASPNKDIERIPLRAPQLLQRFIALPRIVSSGRQHDAPMRGGH